MGALVGVRKLMDFIFTQEELSHLDQVFTKSKINDEKKNHFEKVNLK